MFEVFIVIVAVPTALAVTTPVFDTVATLLFDVDHVKAVWAEEGVVEAFNTADLVPFKSNVNDSLKEIRNNFIKKYIK